MVANIKTTMGISLEQTSLERYRCEVERLAKWCLSQTEVISTTGKFDPCRVVPHDTTCTITLLAGDSRLQARPDKTSPQSKLDIATMVTNNLRQGIIEKSSAPWSSNCVVIRKDGKTRIAVNYRRLNEATDETIIYFQRFLRNMRL